LDRELSKEKSEEFDLHLANCQECREFIGDYKIILRELREFYKRIPIRNQSKDIIDKIMEQLNNGKLSV